MTDTTPWDRVTVVLVTRNSEAVLPASLGSLTRAGRIIMIDAMSTDRTLEVARACYPGIEIIGLTEDRGWGEATNRGFALVETDYVLNINPDTKMPEGLVEQLVRTADANPNAAIVAPVLTNARGDMDLDVMGPWERHHHEISTPPDGPFCTWFVTGAVVIWRMKAFRHVGGFDEDIFLYNEDTDICVRATQKGYALIVDPKAQGDHFGGHSEDISLKSRIRRDKNMAWGHLNYERKWGGRDVAERAAKVLFFKSLGDSILGIVTVRPRKFLTNLAKARVAFSFLRGGSPWGRPGGRS